jgi:hypothetical protein
MNPKDMEVKRKADQMNVNKSGDDSLITKSEMRMPSSAEVMATVKRVVELEASHARVGGRNRELEAKAGALEKLISDAMSTNRELKLKLDKMSVELDVARKVEVRLATTVAEMGAAEMEAPIRHFSNVANYAHSSEGTQAHALASTYRHNIDCVINSRESRFFITYTPYAHSETIQIADGTSQPIHGVGSVECTSSINLSSILHVPSFPVNLLSVSSIIDQFKCIVIFDEHFCVFLEKETGRRIGTGVRRNVLWFIKHGESAMVIDVEGVEREIILRHCRSGHPSFDSLNKLYPDIFKKVDKSRLVCDACELGKHTRSTYPSIGLCSYEPFILIYSNVWGPCPVTSVSGFKWFVTFIDCYTRITWVYMLKHKNEVLQCFQDFHKLAVN